jgi:hypothetical protein
MLITAFAIAFFLIGFGIFAWEFLRDEAWAEHVQQAERAERPRVSRPRDCKPLLPDGYKLIGRGDGRFAVQLPCGEVLFTEVGWTVTEAASAVQLAVETARRMREEMRCEGK